MLPNNLQHKQHDNNTLNNQPLTKTSTNNSTTTPSSSSYPTIPLIVGSSIMNSNISLQSSLGHQVVSDDDINMDDADLGSNNNSVTFEDEEEVNFDDNTDDNNTHNQIITVKKEVEENYYEASQVLDEEDEGEINFDDEVVEVKQQASTSIVACDTTPEEEEELNFDDPIMVNSDDESVDFDDEPPQSLSLSSIKVKVEPGSRSHNSSLSVNMDELDNKMQDDEDQDLNSHIEFPNHDENVNNNSVCHLPQQTQPIPSSEIQVETVGVPNNTEAQTSFESDDLIEDLDFSIGTSETSSLPVSNIKLAGSGSIEQHSLITQPTMESLQQSITSTMDPQMNLDPSLVLPPSPTRSPSPNLLTSEEEITVEPPTITHTPSSSFVTRSYNTQPSSNIITQEIQHTLSDTPSQYKVKKEGLSNTLQDAISVCSDDSEEDEVMMDIVIPSSIPSIPSLPQIIEESEELSDEEDLPEKEQQGSEEEEEEEYSSSSSSSEDEDNLDESDAVSTESGRFNPSPSVRRSATVFRMITKDICTGSFCCGGPLLTRVGLPGLQLILPSDNIIQEPKLKHLTFPIANPEQAKEIIKLSKRASKDSNEFCLNADQFVITNPSWNDMIAELINQCTRGNLGVSREKPVSFQLYQLVLLVEGENKKKKNKLPPNVFAQFVVQLPCSYKGGSSHISFREEKLDYDFTTNSSYIPSYMTYFTECESVEDSIEEGYKLYLVYNLIYDGKPSFKPSLETVHRVAENLKQIEKLWTPQENPFVIYLLDSVKESECRIDLLKGSDIMFYNFINLFNDQFGLFDIYLGIFERTCINKAPKNQKKVVNDDDIYDSDDDSSYLVKRLTNPTTGAVISQTLTVGLSDAIPYDTAINTSNRNCLVIIPKKYHYLSLKFMDAKTCYEGFISLYKEFTTDSSKRNLCIDLASSQTQSQFFRGKLSELIPILLQLGDVELFKQFLNPIPILDLTTWHSVLKHFGIESVRTEFLSGLLLFVCHKNPELEKRANQTFNYLIGLEDEQLSLDFMLRFLDRLDNITNNVNSGILSTTFLVSLINMCSSLKIESEVLGRIALKIIQTSAIETSTEQITQVLKSLFSQKQVSLCNQVFEMVLRRSQPQSFDKILPLVITCISLLGVASIKSKIAEFCNKMINTSTIVSALQIIETSVQKNDEMLYLAKHMRKGVINCLQQSQITLGLCQKVLGVLYRAGFKDDISTITSIIIGKSGMIENSINELLVPLVKWTDKELGKQAFLNPGFNSILQYCINMLRISNANTGGGLEDWSINVNVGCNCEYCVVLSSFLRDKSKTRFELRKPVSERNHVALTAKTAAEKYLAFETVKTGSPHCLVIRKTSSPNDAEKKKAQAAKEIFDYLSRLSTTVMNLNNPSMATSSSSSSINSTTSAKRSYPSSSDSDYDSLRRLHKRR